MHPRTGLIEDGLGHKGGMEAMLVGDGLHHQFKGHNIVGSAKGVVITEVDFMLAACHLMVGGFDLKPHILKGQANIPAGFLTAVDGA